MTETSEERAAKVARLRENVDTWFGAHGADDQQAAMVETAFLMAAADGTIEPEEYEQLVSTLTQVTGSRIGAPRLRIMTRQLEELLALEGWNARIDAVAHALTTMEARRAAYQLAAGVSYVDGEVQQEEIRLFEMLAEHFEIPFPEAEALLQEVHRNIFGSRDELTDPVMMLSKLRGH